MILAGRAFLGLDRPVHPLKSYERRSVAGWPLTGLTKTVKLFAA